MATTDLAALAQGFITSHKRKHGKQTLPWEEWTPVIRSMREANIQWLAIAEWLKANDPRAAHLKVTSLRSLIHRRCRNHESAV